MLEKSVNDLRMKIVDLETRSYKGGKGESNFLAKRIQDVHHLILRANSSWRKNCRNANANCPQNRSRTATSTEKFNLSNTKSSKKKKYEHDWNRISCEVMRRITS